MNKGYIALLTSLALGIVTLTPGAALADSAEIIDVKVDGALKTFRDEVDGAETFLNAAKGVLVFPSVIKAGFGIGGETGEGALRIDGKTVDYYRTSAGSFGFQFGVQSKAVYVVFLDQGALDGFRNSSGWKAGVDGSIALVEIGAGGAIDTKSIQDPVIGFVLTNKGLMYNLTLEGSKYSKLDKKRADDSNDSGDGDAGDAESEAEG